MQLEEFLDAYGARNNQKWFVFRLLISAIKLFSDLSYELLHIQQALPAYRLMPISQDFYGDTKKAAHFAGEILLFTAELVLSQAKELGLPITTEEFDESLYTEQLPPGRLAHDHEMLRTEKVSEVVTLLTTAFLNLASTSEYLQSVSRANPKDFDACVTDSVSEKNLRSLEFQFHNLQSLYDTHVSGTEAEDIDHDLPVLRGHISVVFHLLKTSTLLAHYYERHIKVKPCNCLLSGQTLVNSQTLLATLVNYSVSYASYYIECARLLCQEMLKHYAEVTSIEVNVPCYRGFHVRPATLISKLVFHYGSEVQMELDDQKYDAGAALELFRANEKINACKRRWLVAEIARLELVPEKSCGESISSIVHDVILGLAERGKIILYEQPLQLPDKPENHEPVLLDLYW